MRCSGASQPDKPELAGLKSCIRELLTANKDEESKKADDKHVVASIEMLSDAGSIPATSTISFRKSITSKGLPEL